MIIKSTQIQRKTNKHKYTRELNTQGKCQLTQTNKRDHTDATHSSPPLSSSPPIPLPLPSRPPPSPLVYLPAVTSITTPKGQARHQISVTTIDSDPLHGRRQRIGNSCCAVHGLQFSDIYRWRPSSGACIRLSF